MIHSMLRGTDHIPIFGDETRIDVKKILTSQKKMILIMIKTSFVQGAGEEVC